MTVGDFNGDGKPDLAVTDVVSNSVAVLLNTTVPGATLPVFAAPTTFSTGLGPVDVMVGDFNGDGKPDLAFANFGSNTMSVLLNTTAPGSASPTFAARVSFATQPGPRALVVGDFNSDGQLDIAVANSKGSSRSVSVFLNTTAPGSATPSFAAQTTFALVSNPFSVAVGDFNGDGRPDLVTANYLANSASVLINTTAPRSHHTYLCCPNYLLSGDHAKSRGRGRLQRRRQARFRRRQRGFL